jgi:hypothetical protein
MGFSAGVAKDDGELPIAREVKRLRGGIRFAIDRAIAAREEAPQPAVWGIVQR